MRILFFVVWLFALTTISRAGVFGPSSYEDCILDSMKGVTSDDAARLVQLACREKFPVSYGATPLTADELSKVELSEAQLGNRVPAAQYSAAAVKKIEESGFNTLSFTARNVSDSLTVTSLTIRVQDDVGGTSREYTLACHIKPQASARLDVELPPIRELSRWQLLSAKGTRR